MWATCCRLIGRAQRPRRLSPTWQSRESLIDIASELARSASTNRQAGRLERSLLSSSYSRAFRQGLLRGLLSHASSRAACRLGLGRKIDSFVRDDGTMKYGRSEERRVGK